MKYLTANEARTLTQNDMPKAIKKDLKEVLELIKWAAKKGFYKVSPQKSMFCETERALRDLGYQVENGVIRWEDIG